MAHAENVAVLQAALAPNSRSASNLFLNHDEQILKVVSCDGSNPAVHFTPFWILKFIFKLFRTCCCWLFFWNRGTEKIKNVLVLTNQRLIKFKESTGSQNGDFPKRCTPAFILLQLKHRLHACFILRACFTLHCELQKHHLNTYVTPPYFYLEQVLCPADAPFCHFLHRVRLQPELAHRF